MSWGGGGGVGGGGVAELSPLLAEARADNSLWQFSVLHRGGHTEWYGIDEVPRHTILHQSELHRGREGGREGVRGGEGEREGGRERGREGGREREGE